MSIQTVIIFPDAVNQLEFYEIVHQDDFLLDKYTGDILVSQKMPDYKEYVLYLNIRDHGIPHEFYSE